ncbi:MAG TPA: hemerythrin domain-containing protein [Ferrovibrio sp.]|uniref:hemerythrin domain-containing protein n=1 Tax=Ferrovibrio sp. TaxID=1917215 RepID=UPI002ED55B7A
MLILINAAGTGMHHRGVMNPAGNLVELRQSVTPALLRLFAALGGAAQDGSPFDILAGQRLSLVAVCAIMDALPNTPPALARNIAAALAGFLRHDYLAVITEEEDGLLVKLQPRLLLGDDLDEAIRQLMEEHRRDRQEALLLAAKCDEIATGLSDGEAAATLVALRAFAERQRRHLAWEEAIILPLARDRLSSDDLSQWKQAMKKRLHSVK